MKGKTIESIANSPSSLELIKKLRPSSLFLIVFIFGLGTSIRYFFSDVTGYTVMVWIWFIISIMASVVSIWAYKEDMAEFIKSDKYNELVLEVNELKSKLHKDS